MKEPFKNKVENKAQTASILSSENSVLIFPTRGRDPIYHLCPLKIGMLRNRDGDHDVGDFIPWTPLRTPLLIGRNVVDGAKHCLRLYGVDNQTSFSSLFLACIYTFVPIKPSGSRQRFFVFFAGGIESTSNGPISYFDFRRKSLPYKEMDRLSEHWISPLIGHIKLLARGVPTIAMVEIESGLILVSPMSLHRSSRDQLERFLVST